MTFAYFYLFILRNQCLASYPLNVSSVPASVGVVYIHCLPPLLRHRWGSGQDTGKSPAGPE